MPFRGSFVAVFLLSGFVAAAVRAQEFDCTTALGSVEVSGNLNIAGRCRLAGTEVRGNVTLFAGGSLVARDVRIFGNVEGRRADFVDIDESAIDGNVQLEEFVGDSSTIRRTGVRGNASLTRNRSRLEIVNNDFDGGLRASRNTGGLLISGNSFGGELDCTGNDPRPVGLGNRIEGDAKGQCRNLQPNETSTPPPSSPPPPPTSSAPPPASPPPASSPPPSASPPPTASPPPSAPPPATPPPPSSPPPMSSPPPDTTPPDTTPTTPPAEPGDPVVEDDGGAGAFGWPAVFFVPLLARRRFVRRRTKAFETCSGSKAVRADCRAA